MPLEAARGSFWENYTLVLWSLKHVNTLNFAERMSVHLLSMLPRPSWERIHGAGPGAQCMMLGVTDLSGHVFENTPGFQKLDSGSPCFSENRSNGEVSRTQNFGLVCMLAPGVPWVLP